MNLRPLAKVLKCPQTEVWTAVATTEGTSLLYERLRQRVMLPARQGRTQSPGCRETLPRALIHRNALPRLPEQRLLKQAFRHEVRSRGLCFYSRDFSRRVLLQEVSCRETPLALCVEVLAGSLRCNLGNLAKARQVY